MRVTTLVALLVIVGALVAGFVFRGWVFDRLDASHQYSAGFKPATTPTEAMEKFREAIQQRRYKWAATYVTKDYADILTKTNEPAKAMGELIDHVANYMNDKGLRRDKTILLLHHLDAFPTNFKVYAAPKQTGDRAIGFFVWEPLSMNNPLNPGLTQSDVNGLDPRMLTRVLVPVNLISPGGVELVKEGDAWKINPVITPAHVDTVRWYHDHWKTYHTTLNDFRTYMTNGRYDSPQAFETEVVDAIRKANPK
jgi:hypothetical protein